MKTKLIGLGILAVVILFWGRLWPFGRRKSPLEKRETWSLWGKTIVACIPAAVIGIPIDDWMEANLGSPFIIAAALIVYGIAFIVIETVRERRAAALPEPSRGRHFAAGAEPERPSSTELADAEARIQKVDDIDWKTALGIGLFQVLSIVPGTSRSGSTIIGGLILGCSRTAVAEFTFFLAIPVMFGASALRLVKFFLAGNALSSPEAAILGVGCGGQGSSTRSRR